MLAHKAAIYKPIHHYVICEINIQEDKSGQRLITGYEIIHFNNLITCESGDLASGEILDQRNSGGNFLALAFDKVVFQPVKATQPYVAYDPGVVTHDPYLVALVLNCNKSNNFGLWPFRIPLYIMAVLWYNWSSIGVHWQGGEQGQIGQYLADPTIYGSLCAMWNRNSWCDKHQVPRLEIHTCGNTVARRPERVSLFE